MADARVTFETAGYDPAEPGHEVRFSFRCPKHDRICSGLLIAGKTGLKRDGQGKNGGVPQWVWDGNRESPTISPSIDCGSCWHGYIENGRTVDCQKKDEPEIERKRT